MGKAHHAFGSHFRIDVGLFGGRLVSVGEVRPPQLAASFICRLAQSRRAEGQPRCPLLGVRQTSQALRAHRVITTDDDNSDSRWRFRRATANRSTTTAGRAARTGQHGQRLAPSPRHRHHHDATRQHRAAPSITTTTTTTRVNHHDADRRPIADGITRHEKLSVRITFARRLQRRHHATASPSPAVDAHRIIRDRRPQRQTRQFLKPFRRDGITSDVAAA